MKLVDQSNTSEEIKFSLIGCLVAPRIESLPVDIVWFPIESLPVDIVWFPALTVNQLKFYEYLSN